MNSCWLAEQAEQAIGRLERAGYEAYAVGGCVRDMVRGVTPVDWDLTTSALPEQIQAVFAGEKMGLGGLKHGTVTVVLEGCPLEITTYRVDGAYSDSRHPDQVTFTRSLEEDLARRDFTMNAMAFHPRKGLVDPFGGRQDIENRCIRCVGESSIRFQEDALRILRAIRFVARTGFDIELQTRREMEQWAPRLEEIAGERMQSELIQIVSGPYVGKALRQCRCVVGIWLPELAKTFDCDQCSPHHVYCVWEHTVRAVEISAADPLIRLTMLFHDIGKPAVRTFDENGRGHFYGHQEAGVEITRPILERLRFSRKMTEEILFLIAHHDYPLWADEKKIRRFLAENGEDRFRHLLQVKKADCCGKGIDYIRVGHLLETE